MSDFPLLVLAVIFTVPDFKAFTLPFESTVATDSSELDQVTFLFVVLLGYIVAYKVVVLFIKIYSAELDIFILVAVTGVIVTAQVLLLPFIVLAVIVAVPSFIPVTTPFLSTVATLVFELENVKVLYASVGVIVPLNVKVSPIFILLLVLFNFKLVGALSILK